MLCGVSSGLCWGLELMTGAGGQFWQTCGFVGPLSSACPGATRTMANRPDAQERGKGLGGEMTVVIMEGHLKRGPPG